MPGASEQSILYSDEKFTELRARNCYAYELIFEIEVTIRELIQFLLQKAYGKRWVKEGLPSDVRDKVKAGAEYERRTPWNRLICHRPLYYVDFPDLKKIIINGKNWRAAFEEEFVAKTLADSSLTEIEAIRNAVAHNRIVSNEDITVLEGSHAKLLKSLPVNLRKSVIEGAIHFAPVGESLRALLLALDEAFHAVGDGGAFPQSTLTACETMDEWWFDEIYLCAQLDDILVARELCAMYAKIPSGIGQAVKRRAWAAEHSLADAIRGATAVLDRILRGI